MRQDRAGRRRQARDPIRHVVVLMLENRSFDHMLGSVPGVDGVSPEHSNRDLNDPQQRVYRQQPTTDFALPRDPRHDLADVLQQLELDGPCGGFVTNFSAAYPTATPEQRALVMSYYDDGALTAVHRLAHDFTVCDRWYCSVPGPTWSNRFFLLSGTSQGRVAMPDFPFRPRLHRYDQTTVFDRLNERRVSWRIYYGDVPQSLALAHQRRPANALLYRPLSVFAEKAADAATEFPAFALLEPSYFGKDQNDDHPPSDVRRGEELVADVYDALRANEELWLSTLLVLLFDEHGGFYDHVSPPAAVPPDGHVEEYTFDRYGGRVPALLVSPWIERSVVSTEFDHTGLLRYISDKHALGPLGRRVAQAASFGPELLRLDSPRSDTPADLPRPRRAARPRALRREPPMPSDLNEHQRALLAFSEYLDTQIVEPQAKKTARKRVFESGIAGASAAARERVERFLAQQRKAGRRR
jgi:phospholipase C